MTKIGGYEVTGKIGQGGIGSVYKARQVSLDRLVAIKVLSEKLTDNPDVLDRFNRESLIIGRLNHPNIIHVIDRGIVPEGMPYFVMEYVEGIDLAKAIKTNKLDANRKLDLVIQVCKALSYAHKNGVIHRDIKPSNVLIDTDGNALVLDFGIAKFFDKKGDNTNQTRSDLIMGTLEYMSPEQQTDTSSVTAATDLYSLGALMYELFTGAKTLGRFKRPREINASIAKPLEHVILRCLETEPKDRFASADEIREHLLKLLQGAHLPKAQREQAKKVLPKAEDKFALLDIIKKEDSYGAVYLYQDKANNRLLVIKKRTNASAGLSEAKLLTALKHKNIVNILGASGSERVFIIVMEYLSGGSLTDRLIRPLPWAEALRIGRQICEGLSFAHKNRMAHGNLRPSNILLADSGQVKLTDFGLEEHYTLGQDGVNWYNVCREPRSPGADIFAAGTIFYQMLTGDLPTWKGGRLVHGDYFRLLPIELQGMVTRMLSRDQGARHGSFDQVTEEIDKLLALYKRKRRKPKVAATQAKPPKKWGKRPGWTLFFLALLVVVALLYLNHTGEIKTYTDAILAQWNKIVSQLGPLFRK